MFSPEVQHRKLIRVRYLNGRLNTKQHVEKLCLSADTKPVVIVTFELSLVL